MADTKISALTDGGTLRSGDLIPVVRSGSNRRVAYLPPVFNARSSEYGALADGTSDDRTAINAAVDAAYAAGGGTVYLPAGTYIVSGTGTASQGAILLKSGVRLVGAGMGRTILKMKNSMGSAVTGIVRTPSATSVSGVYVSDLTIDGNKANNVGVNIDGFYTGVSPSLSITGISVSGTTGTVTTAAAHGLTNGATVSIFGANQSALNGDFTIGGASGSSFTITVANGTSSETASPAYLWYYATSLANAYCYDVACERVEIKNCTRYGFDPHERCRRLILRDCVAHDNDQDGFVADYLVDSLFENPISYGNGRHGINVTTASGTLRITNPICYGNGATSSGSGLVIQRGSNNFPLPGKITVANPITYGNTRDGILLQLAKDVVILGAQSFENGWSGIRMAGSTYCTVVAQAVRDNSQTTNNAKSEILVQEYDDTAGASGQVIGSSYNVIDAGNIRSTLSNKAKYSIEEAADSSGNNRYLLNAASGAATAAHSIGSSTSILIKPFAASGVVALTATVSWTAGTPPSGTNNSSYAWQKVGTSVMGEIRLDYAVAGATITGVDIDLPSDMPAPLDLTNVSNLSMITAGSALFTTNLTNNSSSARCILVKDSGSASGYKVRVFGTSGSYLGCVIQFNYVAANAL